MTSTAARIIWDNKNNAALRALVAQGLNTEQIAGRMGTSSAAITKRRLVLGCSAVRGGGGVWTPERVAKATAMYARGQSASEIARELGLGISRNAVIGKMHRLGLECVAVRQAAAPRTLRAPAVQRAPSEGNGANFRKAPAVQKTKGGKPPPPTREASAFVFGPTGGDGAGPKPPQPIRERNESPGSATIHTLGSHMCKWPIGDPSRDGFSFCGRRKGDGPYCADHARIAYQPQSPGTKRKANDLARSLRRYI